MKNKIHIYIFEDEWMWTEAIKSAIKKNNNILVVGEAKNAEKGINEIKQLNPDIILMDIRLQGSIDGIDAAKKIIESQPAIKIIIFTNAPEEDLLFRAIDAGVSGYLLKKEINDPGILINAINEVYQNQAYITPNITKQVLELLRKCKSQYNPYNLTEREQEILSYVKQGHTNKEIAHALGIKQRTVANHMSNLFQKLGVSNRVEALHKLKNI